MKLFSFPNPEDGQSAFCYLRKLSLENGQPSVGFMKEKLLGDRNICPLKLTAFDMLHLLRGRSKHVKKLTLLSTDKKSKLHQYGDMEIPSHHLHQKEMYCPNCLKEQGYMLSKWQIGWLPMCLKHERPLLPVSDELESQMANGRKLSYKAQERRYYDLFGHGKVCEIQQKLEERLAAESRGYSRHGSLVEEIDQFLMKSLRLSSKDQLLSRKRRYALHYYPLKEMDRIKFLDCISSQQLAA